jgi:hypothetical protein
MFDEIWFDGTKINIIPLLFVGVFKRNTCVVRNSKFVQFLKDYYADKLTELNIKHIFN